MEHQSSEQKLISSEQNPFSEGKHSKSKQLLKRCLNEIGNPSQISQNLTQRQMQKIAAPKPIKARQMALNHHTTSKWIETSPIKNELECEESVDTNEIEEGNGNCSMQLNTSAFGLKNLKFQNEQKLSEFDCAKKIEFKSKPECLSDLESLMEAEEELSAIFNKPKDSLFKGSRSIKPDWVLFNADTNSDSTIISQQEENQSTFENSRTTNTSKVGFSNFGHFRAPIKRPQCNPLLKDERFKRLNTVNEGIKSHINNNPLLQAPCNSQEVAYQRYNNQDLSQTCQLKPPQLPQMFAYSQTTSPTAAHSSSNMNPFSFHDTSNSNFSWYEPSQQQHFDQFAMTQSYHQQQFDNQIFSSNYDNMANSAPEAQQFYLAQAVDSYTCEYYDQQQQNCYKNYYPTNLSFNQ